jgi:putative peptidoglycan lipid II flippase
MLAAVFLASFLPAGGIAALHFAERLLEIPLGLIGSSLGLAALAGLAGNDAADKRREFRRALGAALHLALFLGIPAALGLGALATPLTALLFGHGVFDARALAETSLALAVLSAGLPAMMAAKPLLAALNALNDRQGAARATLAGLALVLLGGGLILALDAGRPQPPFAPALAVSLAAWLSLPLLVRSLARRGAQPEFSCRRMLPVGAGTAALALFLMLLDSAGLRPLIHVPLAGAAGFALYMAVAALCKSPDAAVCLALARNGARNKKK